jgi:hypothetical protein
VQIGYRVLRRVKDLAISRLTEPCESRSQFEQSKKFIIQPLVDDDLQVYT